MTLLTLTQDLWIVGEYHVHGFTKLGGDVIARRDITKGWIQELFNARRQKSRKKDGRSLGEWTWVNWSFIGGGVWKCVFEMMNWETQHKGENDFQREDKGKVQKSEMRLTALSDVCFFSYKG